MNVKHLFLDTKGKNIQLKGETLFLKSNHCQETSLKYFTNQNFIASQSRLPVGQCVGTPDGVGSNDGNFSC